MNEYVPSQLLQSLDLIDLNSSLWMQIKAGQGYSGKRTMNSLTKFNELFSFEQEESNEDLNTGEDTLEDDFELLGNIENE